MQSPERIDVHAHGFSESYLRSIATNYPASVRVEEASSRTPVCAVWSGVPIPAWDLQRRLDDMDRDGVEIEILSAPTIYGQMDGHTADYCRMMNDFQAEIAAQSPERFKSLIHLPVHEISSALAELKRWKGRPECVGVVFGSNMGGIYPGDEKMWPIWEAIAEADLSVLIHPVPPQARFGPMIPPILMFPFDSTTAAASILYADLFDRFPQLKIIISHLGGALPFLRTRLDMALDIEGLPPAHGQNLPNRPSSYVERLYVDTAQGFHRPSLDCACAVMGTDHLHFNSQWRSQLNHFLETVSFDRRQRYAILRGNAERLLLS